MIAKLMTTLALAAAVTGSIANLTTPAAVYAQSSDVVRAELAPTGKFRLSFVALNELIVRKDAQTGQWRGMVVEIGKAIAGRLQVPFEPVPYPEVVSLNQSIDKGAWDATMRSFDAARAGELAFTSPFMEVGSSFLVGPGSTLQHVDEIDRPGVRVAFSRSGVIDNHFKRHPLKHATIERTAGPDPAIEMVQAGQADAFAQNREFLAALSQRIPGSRVLDGSYATLGFSLAVPKARSAAAAEALSKLMEDLKASGFVAAAMARSGLKAAKAAPTKP